MAFGAMGGPISGLIITCKTPDTGTVALEAGDAVKLTGDYEISNAFVEGDRVFGEAMADCAENGAAVPVQVRGVCVFRYSGAAPAVDGVSGVTPSTEAGRVLVADTAAARGLAVQVNPEAGTVEVLL